MLKPPGPDRRSVRTSWFSCLHLPPSRLLSWRPLSLRHNVRRIRWSPFILIGDGRVAVAQPSA